MRTGIRPVRTGIRKATGDQAKAVSAKEVKAKVKVKAVQTVVLNSKTAALRQATLITAAVAMPAAEAKDRVKVKVKAKEEETITTMAAGTKEVMTITGTALISETTAAAKADVAEGRNSHHGRKSTTRRRRLSSAVR